MEDTVTDNCKLNKRPLTCEGSSRKIRGVDLDMIKNLNNHISFIKEKDKMYQYARELCMDRDSLGQLENSSIEENNSEMKNKSANQRADNNTKKG